MATPGAFDVTLWLILLVVLVLSCFSCETRVKLCGGAKAAGKDKRSDRDSDGGESDAKASEEGRGKRRAAPRTEWWWVLSVVPLPHESHPSYRKARRKCFCAGGCKLAAACIFSYCFMLIILRMWIGAEEPGVVFHPAPASSCTAGATEAESCDFSQSEVPRRAYTFGSGKSLSLNGWLMSSNATDMPASKQKFVPILYSHGRDSNIATRHNIERYKFLLTQGVHLFAYDYPGYGHSIVAGSTTRVDPSEATVLFAAAEAFDFFTALPQVAATSSYVVGMGVGLGGPVTARTSQVRSLGSMALMNTYSSMAAYVRSWFPIAGWLVGMSVTNSFKGELAMTDFAGCVYGAQSSADPEVPLQLGKTLYDKGASTPFQVACSNFVETTSAHNAPLTDKEKSTLAAWLDARRADLP